MTPERVFGAAHEQDGVTVSPAARVLAGGGFGRDPKQTDPDIGGGLGIVAYPVGAYVIDHRNVSWRPAWDVNRRVVGAEVLMLCLRRCDDFTALAVTDGARGVNGRTPQHWLPLHASVAPRLRPLVDGFRRPDPDGRRMLRTER